MQTFLNLFAEGSHLRFFNDRVAAVEGTRVTEGVNDKVSVGEVVH